MSDFQQYQLKEDSAVKVAEKLLTEYLSSSPEAFKEFMYANGVEKIANNLALAYFTLAKALHTGEVKTDNG